MLSIAQKYFDLGFNVVPCKYQDKIPVVRWKQYVTQRQTLSELQRIFSSVDKCNFAVVLGEHPYHVVVVDIDSTDQFSVLKKKGFTTKTWIAKTARGYHFYYKTSGVVPSCRLAEGVDLKGYSSIVLVAPSVHPSGVKYKWIHSPKDFPLADAPSVITELKKEKNQVADIVNKIPRNGERNVTLAKFLGLIARYNVSPDELLEIAMAWNGRLEDPLPEQEIRKTVFSIWNREMQQRQKVYYIL